MQNSDCLDEYDNEPSITRFLGYSDDYEHYVDMHDVIYPDNKRMKVIDFI